MKRRLFLAVLAVLVLMTFFASIALAVGLNNFQSVNTYPQDKFTDVPASAWYAANVQKCYNLGLLNGKSDKLFAPSSELTVAEAIKLASCLHSIYTTGKADFVIGSPWYENYVDYALSNGIIQEEYSNYNAKATRAQFAEIFAFALPEEALPEINQVVDHAIPDINMDADYADAVYRLYRAGILGGNDKAGTFAPNSCILRCEVAAIATRMADASLRVRVSFTNVAAQFGQTNTFAVHFIDVGQADAALVLCDGKSMLIDGGNVADSSTIVAYLKKQNISHLDYLVCTHAHEDHVGGLSGALNACTVGQAWSPVRDNDTLAFGNFAKYLAKQQLSLIIPQVGDRYSLGSSEIIVIGPQKEYADANNTSIVLKIVYGNTSFLFTGDAERESEQDILDSGADISATLLKVGHHGSENSTSYVFLREIMPKYAVISVGTDNSYGHPHEATLSRLRDAEVQVYRTDMQGDIIAVSDGKNITITTARNQNVQTNPTENAGQVNNGVTDPVVTNTNSPTPPDDYAYIGNINSKKFHLPSCSSLPNESNRVYFMSRDEAIVAGYTPCGLCKP